MEGACETDGAGVGQVDEVARWNTQLGGEARTLGTEGILGDLDNEMLALPHSPLDGQFGTVIIFAPRAANV